ncbi:isochorismatase family protein [Leucobacter weissii]|uniref:Isochorismatase family protein n=1 Tax=Leucobacter weissii TaxID=1983706 RepID=A0A939MKS1_9MICO|nr:isochorismatase family protein [Leucobacter weissii]MBO1902401.1 isochorismatase family protein [Leucobacter weissii]
MSSAPRPARRALVVVDVQQEYFSGRLGIQYPPREQSLARIIDLLGAADAAGMPVAVIQHENPVGAPAFALGSPGHELHPELARRLRPEWKRVSKRFASAFDGTELLDWSRALGIDTLTLVGYMTNNCLLATAAAAAPLGLDIEVVSDASGAVHLSNEAGSVSAEHLHRTLMVLLQSNFAAVTEADAWIAAVRDGARPPRSNLIASATAFGPPG